MYVTFSFPSCSFGLGHFKVNVRMFAYALTKILRKGFSKWFIFSKIRNFENLFLGIFVSVVEGSGYSIRIR